MEAVGLAASVLTLISAAALTSSTLTRLWRLQGCPNYVVTALNDIEDFRAVLTLVKAMIERREPPEDVLVEIARLLARAEEQIGKFDRYLKDEVVQSPQTPHQETRIKLRRRAKLKEAIGAAREQFDDFQQGLQSIKGNLVVVLEVVNM